MRVSEKRLRRIAREAHAMSDRELIRESLLLQEFLGSILKAVTSPFRGLMNIYKQGIFNWLGKRGQIMLRNAFGTQKDVDRKIALQAEQEAASQLEDMSETEAIESVDSLADSVTEEIGKLMNVPVFPTFGRIDRETGPEKDDDDKKFKEEVKGIMERCRDLVKAGAKFRGALKALSKSGAAPELKVPESPIDISFPLSYVSSLGALAKSLSSKHPSSSLESLSAAAEAFAKKKTPQLQRLTDRVEEEGKNEAAARVIVYGRILSERSVRKGRVV